MLGMTVRNDSPTSSTQVSPRSRSRKAMLAQLFISRRTMAAALLLTTWTRYSPVSSRDRRTCSPKLGLGVTPRTQVGASREASVSRLKSGEQGRQMTD